MVTPRQTILIVDDDEDLRNLAKKILEGAGFDTFEAPSVKDAWIALDKIIPHLILLDMNMPEEDGLHFLEQRKNNLKISHSPVVVLSADSDREKINQAITLGASHYLMKPLESKILLARIKQTLASSESGDKLSITFESSIKTRAKILACLSKVGENDLVISSPIKFSMKTKAFLHSSFFSSFGKEEVILKIEEDTKQIRQGDNYQCTFKTFGLNADELGKIVKEIKHWK